MFIVLYSSLVITLLRKPVLDVMLILFNLFRHHLAEDARDGFHAKCVIFS